MFSFSPKIKKDGHHSHRSKLSNNSMKKFSQERSLKPKQHAVIKLSKSGSQPVSQPSSFRIAPVANPLLEQSAGEGKITLKYLHRRLERSQSK